jgi:hypothetical protein
MTSLIGLLGVYADVVIMLSLAAAFASSRVSQLARSVIATGAFACAWLTTAVLGAARSPAWTVVASGAVIVVSVLAVTATVHLWTQESDSGENEPEHPGNGGGGGPRRRRPDAPLHGGGDGPSWWPEFERQLALYVAESEERVGNPYRTA